MLVYADGRQSGTIGGGAFEQQVLEAARALLADPAATARLVEAHLTHDLGMCCGGRMKVFLEKVSPPDRLFLFGAGHVGKALCEVALSLGFGVSIADARPEWLNEVRFPRAERSLGDPLAYARGPAAQAAGAFACVMTHDHQLDQEVTEALLAAPLRYLGVIGSLRKAERLRSRLAAQGFAPEAIARVRTPMGVEVGAQTAEEIAVAIAADLIAVRRGVALDSFRQAGEHRR
jgi:xanthine dehydrogenase accessory factor